MNRNNNDYLTESISEAVLSVAKQIPQKTAITYMNRHISYKTLLQKVQKLAVSFFELGIKRGDIVLIALPNIPQAVYTLYALNRIGAVPAFVSPLSAEAELQFYINKCKCQFIIALDVLCEKFLKVFKAVGERRLIITSPFDELFFPFLGKKQQALSWNNMMKNKNSKNIFISSQKADDTAVILFSGGTTGAPKAVELTNLNLNALAKGTEAACGKDVREVKMLSVLPVFHGFGLGICIHTVLFFGGNVLLVPRFDFQKTGKIIAKNMPQYITCVPAMLEPIMKSKYLKKADLSFLSGVFSGGDRLDLVLGERFNEFLFTHNAKIKIRQGYGLTECVAASCLMPDLIQKDGSVGKPYPETLYKIVKPDTLEEVSFGIEGEICISGKTVMKGYLDDRDENKKVLRYHKDGKLWLHTGDIGYIDKDGFVYFKGRIKRIIISNGHNVYPAEIEKALMKLNNIKECCAVGVKDLRKIQSVAVFVVTHQKGVYTKEQIIKHLEACISKHAIPKYIYFTQKLPKTNFGKVAYKELEKLAESNI